MLLAVFLNKRFSLQILLRLRSGHVDQSVSITGRANPRHWHTVRLCRSNGIAHSHGKLIPRIFCRELFVSLYQSGWDRITFQLTATYYVCRWFFKICVERRTFRSVCVRVLASGDIYIDYYYFWSKLFVMIRPGEKGRVTFQAKQLSKRQFTRTWLSNLN